MADRRKTSAAAESRAARRVSPLSRQAIEADRCTIDVKLRVLGNLPFLADLAEPQIRQVSGVFHDSGYAPGAQVYRAGAAATRLFVVAAGRVKLVRAGAGGQELLVDMLGEGDYFGSLEHLGEDTYSDSAVAHVSSCVLAVSSGDFQAILERFPSVSRRLVGILAERLRLAHDQLEMMNGLTVEGRVAFVLLRLARRFGEQRRFGTLIQLPLSREELGEMAGTTTESASRAISRLSRAGLIRTGRRWVAVVDPQQLSEAAASRD